MSIVMKFGGTSVADAAALENVARIVAARRDQAPVVVVSAMSGVTDALLSSTRIASERDAEEATASLAETFRRHEQAAEELLPSPAGFIDYLNNAAKQISQLLTRAADGRATQDAIVSFGEMLSSRLLAETLKHRGVNAQQVDPRCCIIKEC